VLRKIRAALAWCVFAQTLSVFAQKPVNPSSISQGPDRRGPQAARSADGAAASGHRSFDKAVVDRGKTLFLANCGFCHGEEARGGDSGPDLVRSKIVLKDDGGSAIGDFLKVGRVEKGMPAFSNLMPRQVLQIAAFLHQQVESHQDDAPLEASRVVVGDPRAGAIYFNGAGKCNKCHSVTSDLKGIGTKYDAMALQDKFVNPRGTGRGTDPPEASQQRVVVTLPSGEMAAGVLLYISEFAVMLRDSSGNRRTFSRNGVEPKVEIKDPLQAHLNLLMKYSDRDIHDVAAYLVTLK